GRAVTYLRLTAAAAIPVHLLAYTSPLGWSHISLTCDYVREQAAIAIGRYPDAYPKKGGRQFLGGLIGDDGGRAIGLRTVLVAGAFVRNNVTEQLPCLAFEARHTHRLDRIEISWASVYLDAVKDHWKLDVLQIGSLLHDVGAG